MAKPSRAERKRIREQAIFQSKQKELTTGESNRASGTIRQTTEFIPHAILDHTPIIARSLATTPSSSPPRKGIRLWRWIGQKWKWDGILSIGTLGMVKLHEWGAAIFLLVVVAIPLISRLSRWEGVPDLATLSKWLRRCSYVGVTIVTLILGAIINNNRRDEPWSTFLPQKTVQQTGRKDVPSSSDPGKIAEVVALKDIADFASSRTIAIAPGRFNKPPSIIGKPYDPTFRLSGTAFWVQVGYAVTCSSKAVASQKDFVALHPGKPAIEPFGNGQFETTGMTAISNSRVVQDGGGVAILSVSPAQYFGGIIRATGNPGDGAEHSWSAGHPYAVPPTFMLSTALPIVDERMFIYGAEQGGIPSFSPREGKIIRSGTGKLNFLSAYSDVPFRKTYCGSPVINESKEVIGIVVGKSDTGETEIVLSQAIVDLLKRIGLK